jgi:hypothetical protein
MNTVCHISLSTVHPVGRLFLLAHFFFFFFFFWVRVGVFDSMLVMSLLGLDHPEIVE